MASSILLAGVLAVITAITTGQQQVAEAQMQIEAMRTAEELLDDIVQTDYLAIVGTWNNGMSVVETNFATLLLSTTATASNIDPDYLGIVVAGINVTVTAKELPSMREVVHVEVFLPEPQS